MCLQKLSKLLISGLKRRLKLKNDVALLDNMGANLPAAGLESSVAPLLEAESNTVPLCSLFCVANPEGQMPKVVELALLVADTFVGVFDADLRAGDDFLFSLFGLNLCDLEIIMLDYNFNCLDLLQWLNSFLLFLIINKCLERKLCERILRTSFS